LFIRKVRKQGLQKMVMVKNEDIRGYRINDKIVCPDCMKPTEIEKCNQADLILIWELEENVYWCDRCKNLIG